MAKDLSSVRRKIERARKHTDDLEAEIIAFWNTKPYEIEIQGNPRTGPGFYPQCRDQHRSRITQGSARVTVPHKLPPRAAAGLSLPSVPDTGHLPPVLTASYRIVRRLRVLRAVRT